MADQIVRICLEDGSWRAKLIPDGTTIGRDKTCDIVIDSRHVSRRHARIVSTGDGKWSVEDLGSSNGTFVNGQRVELCPISGTDVIEIGPASLSFSPLVEQATRLGAEKPNIIIEDFGTEVFYDKPKLEDCQRQPCPERLEKAKQHLSGLDRPEAVHRELCRLLASEPTTAAAVFRESTPDTGAPEVVA